jgi:phosphoglycolate phosphatase-like HAD superfamily hydrolase
MSGSSNQRSTRLLRRAARDGGYSLELPICKQFTPEQVRSLLEFLRIVHEHGPDAGASKTEARARVKERLFADPRRGGTEEKRVTQAGNALMSARYWGLLHADGALTDVGRAALASGDEEGAVRVMVEHFLRHLGGAQTVKAIFDLIRANDGLAPEKTALAAKLRAMRIYENADGTDHSAVLAWLAHPGARVVFARGRSRWRLDEGQFAALAGMAAEQVDAIASRDPVQIALLVELARTPEGRSDSGAMQRLLSIRPDLDVHAPAFRSRYLDPLAGAGLIEIAAGRRGAGATVFSITELGRSEAVQDLLDRFDVDGALGYRSSDLLRPTNEIVAELDSEDRHRRGIALEHLALRMLDWIGLSDLRWRVRPGANAEEIDGTANAKLPAFARWQVQAKNTSRLDADDAAKEVGLAVTNGAAVVMLITTGSFTAAARDIVERAERRGGLAIVCLDGEDVQEIADEPARLREKLARESARVHARH